MRKAMIVGMMALAGMNVHAGQQKGQVACQVRVYLENQKIAHSRVLFPAEVMATRMFAGIGVRVCWKLGSPRSARGAGRAGVPQHAGLDIVLRLVSNEPGNIHEGALGYALPFSKSGVRVTLFYDRALGPVVGSEGAAAVLLAHVLAHEITHVLQGTARHSEEGIMKAHWTPEDQARMMVAPLPFTDFDVQLIQRAMATGTGVVEIAAR
jgi:hypothetical protein